MAIVFNGQTVNWDDGLIYGSSDDVIENVYFDGVKVFGTSGSDYTQIFSFGLAPDSYNFEGTTVPQLQTTYAEAFESQGYTQGPGGDSTYRVYMARGYRVVTSDGTFTGPGTEVRFWEGRTVTGVNTSHNGGTSISLQKDNGV